MRPPFLVDRKPRVFGHRGAAGLAPENTLPSFALGLTLGADILELDVHASRDGIIVVIHDPTLERTTNGSGEVRDHTFHELRQLDAGYHFTRDGRDFPFRGQGVRLCTLEEVLREFPLAPCNIELKQGEPSIVADVVQLITRLDAHRRVLLAAEHDEIMREIRACSGEIATSFSAAEVADFVRRCASGDLAGFRPAGCALQIPPRFGDFDLVTTASVEAAHAAGLDVHVWTINHRDEMDALLALGVDGIISDLPGVARLAVDAAPPRQR
ncbi:glycerophosphodiester phosphodiesterase [Candidatus Binatia bacterium]|nr:glycerophosphodiester phosphodiesterase [Candidatus Binatia bacterium]